MPKTKKKPPYTVTVRYMTATKRTKTEVIYGRKSEKVTFRTPEELDRLIGEISDREQTHRDPFEKPGSKYRDKTHDSGFCFLDARGFEIYQHNLVRSILNKFELRDQPWGYRPGTVKTFEDQLFDLELIDALADGRVTPDLLFASTSTMKAAEAIFTEKRFASLRRAMAIRVMAWINNHDHMLRASAKRNFSSTHECGAIDILPLYRRLKAEEAKGAKV